MNLTNNTILITGGSKGIGFYLAKKFVELNNKVIICGRNEDSLAQAKKDLKNVHTIKCDISNDYDRQKLLNFLNNEFSDINVLINNAGIQRDIDFSNNEDDLFGLDEISINLSAPIHLIKTISPLLLKNPNPTLINVSSQLGFMPMAKSPVYCATKAAMHSLTKSIRHQLKDVMEVIEIVPPAVDTNLNPEGRAKSNFVFDLKPDVYVEDVFEKLEKGNSEIFFSTNLDNLDTKTKKDMDLIFEKMNSGKF